MSFLFKSKHKSPQELVRNTKDCLLKLEQAGDQKKNVETISNNLVSMKQVLYGDAENDPNPDVVAQLSQEIYNTDCLVLLVQNLGKLEFEAKKDTAQIYSNLLRRQLGTRYPTVEYLCTKEFILLDLLKGYEVPDSALNSGQILRECIRHESLAKSILNSEQFYQFFNFIEVPTFDIASDSFSTFKELLTKHKIIVAEFLEKNYDKFFENFIDLLNSTNYVTKRQSLKLLGELLLDRSNFNVMTKFIGDPDNLKLMMTLLRAPSKNIQFEAFHVFKIFVANPNKTKPVLDILVKNKEKLVNFLSSFQNDRQDDEQFNDEKAFLLKQIQEL